MTSGDRLYRVVQNAIVICYIIDVRLSVRQVVSKRMQIVKLSPPARTAMTLVFLHQFCIII